MKPNDTKVARPDPISMRLPEELKSSLSEAAKTAGRSLNAEIRVRLEWSLERAPELAGVISSTAGLEQRVATLEAAVFGSDNADTDDEVTFDLMSARVGKLANE